MPAREAGIRDPAIVMGKHYAAVGERGAEPVVMQAAVTSTIVKGSKVGRREGLSVHCVTIQLKAGPARLLPVQGDVIRKAAVAGAEGQVRRCTQQPAALQLQTADLDFPAIAEQRDVQRASRRQILRSIQRYLDSKTNMLPLPGIVSKVSQSNPDTVAAVGAGERFRHDCAFEAGHTVDRPAPLPARRWAERQG